MCVPFYILVVFEHIMMPFNDTCIQVIACTTEQPYSIYFPSVVFSIISSNIYVNSDSPDLSIDLPSN